MITLTDLFCGAGGSSTGATQVPGVRVTMAANHWQLACDVHNANHPDTDHAAVDLHEEDPRFFSRTDILWASPECTKWSQASGKQRPAIEEGLFADPHADDVAVRSRLLMFDVLKFAEHHRYSAIIIENVVDIAVSSKYSLAWSEWQRQLRNLGYRYRVVSLNSMHAQAHGDPAPQSRDRIYIVCWLDTVPAPDIDAVLRPKAWCPRCERMVESQQAWKNDRTVGKYRQQYIYVHARCGTTVEPGWLPASAAIDWTVPGTPIGDRPRPLAAKTRARIAAGIARYWMEPFLAEVAGHTYERHPGVRTRPVGDPMNTMTTTQTGALLVPVEGRDGKVAAPSWHPGRTQTTRNETGLLVPCGGTWNDDATTLHDPTRTITTRDSYATVVPPFLTQFRDRVRDLDPSQEPLSTIVADGANHGLVHAPFISELRGGGSLASSTTEPLATVTASGNHHGLVSAPEPLILDYYSNGSSAPVSREMPTMMTIDKHALLMRNNSSKGPGAEMTTPVTEYMRTITTTAHQSLIQHPGPRKPRPRPTEDAVAAAERYVDECLFRMLAPREAAAAQAFPRDYRWDTPEAKKISDRNLVKLAGNAVTPPAARDLVAAVARSLGAS